MMRELLITELAKLANAGNPDAQIELAERYENGVGGVEMDLSSAIRMYKSAYQAGRVELAKKIGMLCLSDDPTVNNPDEAIEWYRIASDNGDEGATRFLASAYSTGIYVVKNKKQADEYNRRLSVLTGQNRTMTTNQTTVSSAAANVSNITQQNTAPAAARGNQNKTGLLVTLFVLIAIALMLCGACLIIGMSSEFKLPDLSSVFSGNDYSSGVIPAGPDASEPKTNNNAGGWQETTPKDKDTTPPTTIENVKPPKGSESSSPTITENVNPPTEPDTDIPGVIGTEKPPMNTITDPNDQKNPTPDDGKKDEPSDEQKREDALSNYLKMCCSAHSFDSCNYKYTTVYDEDGTTRYVYDCYGVFYYVSENGKKIDCVQESTRYSVWDNGKLTGGTYYTYASPYLRIRSEPTTSSGEVGQIPLGSKVEISYIRDNWGKVTYNGKDGWISMDYVDKPCVLNSYIGQTADVLDAVKNNAPWVTDYISQNYFRSSYPRRLYGSDWEITSTGVNTYKGRCYLWDTSYNDKKEITVYEFECTLNGTTLTITDTFRIR